MSAAVATPNVLVSDLNQRMRLFKQKQLTGIVLVESGIIHRWRLYFLAGQLVWASTRTHAKRRWFRQLLMHRSDLRRFGLDTLSDWNYHQLARLVTGKKLSRTVFSKVVSGCIREVLFDLQQQGTLNLEQTGQRLTYRIKCQKAYDFPYLNLQNVGIWGQARHDWQRWEQAELHQINPNDALVLKDLSALEDLASPRLVNLLSALADGSHTLRDIALTANQALMPFALSILPHIRNHSLQLTSAEDTVPHSLNTFQNDVVARLTQTIPKDARIVYVDDSLADSQTMATIVEAAGYRYTNIAEPLGVLKQLVQLKPKVVFLQLTMPVVNGYELCAQIRRMADFKDIPIVMVGSGSSFAERMRAKMVGASGFLDKPLKPKKVLKTLIVLGVI